MGQAVEERRGHLCVTEDGRPFAEGQVGGDDDGGAFVEAADQVPLKKAKARSCASKTISWLSRM